MFSPAARVKSALDGFISRQERDGPDSPGPSDPSWDGGADAGRKGRYPNAGGETAVGATPSPVELGGLEKLPPFKPVVIRLLRSFDRDDVSTAEIAGLVESDPAVASEILAAANSPMFALRTRVTVPGHALSLLGLARSKSLVSSLAMRAMMASAPKTPVVRRFWMHSAATAAITQEMAPLFGVAADLAHTAAILHDLGRMGLLAAHTEPYTVLALRAYETVEEVVAAEDALCGMNHCHAGLLLAQAWDLPKVFHDAVAEHHGTPSGRDLRSLVQTSCRLADDMMFQAILHRSHRHPQETIEACAPEELREALVEKLTDAEARVIRTIQSLDF
jgi:putative nucleotidyltransferase with HDIG domain